MLVEIIGYRDWALALAKNVEQHFGDTVSVNILQDAQATSAAADLVFLVGWSEIVPPSFYKDRTVLVLHPSPLPRYRGGSPIQHQIMDGETVSAVSLFRLDSDHPDVDSGPLAWQQGFSLEGSLGDVLARIVTVGTRGVIDTIEAQRAGLLAFWEQPGGWYDTRRRRTPAQSEITAEELRMLTARQLHDRVRALADPYPNAYIVDPFGGRLYITETHLEDA